MVDAYINMWKNYAKFSGRSGLGDFWWTVLANFIVGVVLGIITAILPTLGGIITGAYSLAVIIPSLALTVRRLHDIDKAGWWIFISIVPVVGEILLIIFLASRGTDGTNRFDEDVVE